MGIKSILVQWPDVLDAGKHLLHRLATYTNFNTVELSNFYIDWFQRKSHGERVPLALPSARAFKNTPVPTMREADFQRVDRFLNLAKNERFQVACNLTPLYVGVGQESDLSLVDASGRLTPGVRSYLAYGCPNNPRVVSYAKAAIREHIRTWTALDHISINHAEYPFWPRTRGIESLFTCFCESCRRKAVRAGLDFSRMRREVLDIVSWIQRRRTAAGDPSLAGVTPNDFVNLMTERPYLAHWLHFRLSSMTGFLSEVIQEGRAAAKDHNPSVKIGLEFQLPSLSRLVGTDYVALHDKVDWIAPKFPEYLGGTVIPLIAQILAERTGSVESVGELREILRSWLDMGDGPAKYIPIKKPEEELLFSNTFSAAIIGLQMKHIRSLTDKVAVYPYLWEYNHDLRALREKIAAVKDLGFKGYFFTCWYQDITARALRSGRDIFKLL